MNCKKLPETIAIQPKTKIDIVAIRLKIKIGIVESLMT